MESAESYCMALSAVPDEEVGRRIAQRLLEARAAACVNLVPGLESRYWWKGEIQRDSEALLLIKTSWDRVEAVEKLLLEAHPYETPELIILPLSRGSAGYLNWLAAELNAGGSG